MPFYFGFKLYTNSRNCTWIGRSQNKQRNQKHQQC